MKSVIAQLVACAVVSVGTRAQAAPLSLTDLDALTPSLTCRTLCPDGAAGDACRAECPAPPTGWDKDGDNVLSRADKELATLEYWDDSDLVYVCYQTRPGATGNVSVVVPSPQCETGACADHHTPAECADSDGDGIPAWQENFIGTSDNAKNQRCTNDEVCGFSGHCEFKYALNGMLCMPRDCGSQDCTAFHLETVEVNNQELIVHVYYDHSPKPATVLDLKLTYDRQALAPVDARPLPVLRESGKSVLASTLSDGTLRLVVLGSLSVSPVPTGAIIELVFQRTSMSRSTIAFVTNDYAQTHALAPSQGEAQNELANDALWGEATVGGQVPGGPRLVLSYGFDTLARPLSYKDVPSEADLCSSMASCAHAQAPDQNRMKEALQSLQRGAVVGGESVVGVAGQALYEGGSHDHIRMPVFLNEPHETSAQSFTISGWFYAEGNGPEELSSGPHLLVSHNNYLEHTQFGLMLLPAGASAFDLAWFDGPVNGGNRTVVAPNLALLRWTHFALSVDVKAEQTKIYVDGKLVRQLAIQSDSLACPKFGAPPTNDLQLHSWGDVAGGHAPQYLYMATARNNIFGIERMDLVGIVRQDIIRDGEHAYQDPDYSPITGKVVYSSNESGSFEIWVANADGGDKRQLTKGFGDTNRAIFARNPRWAPDGSAIVFESNVFDLTKFYNSAVRGYRLYFVEYDPNADGGLGAFNPNVMDAGVLLSNGSLADSCLTKGNENYYGAHWLAGPTATTRGQIVFTKANDRMRDNIVMTLAIAQNVGSSQPENFVGLGFAPDDEVVALAAHRSVRPSRSPQEISRLLVKRSWPAYEQNTEYTIATEESASINVDLTYAPAEPSATCWDKNRNGQLDPDEDMNADGKATTADCYAFEERNLYLAYDPAVVEPEIAASTWGAVIGPDAGNKVLELREMFVPGGAFLRVEVRSPYNSDPLPSQALIARLAFRRVAEGNPAFALKSRIGHDELYIKDLLTPERPQLLDGAAIDEALGAAFSPDGGSLVMAAIVHSRPTLLHTANLATLAGSERIAPEAMMVHGLSFTEDAFSYYPCTWLGAFRDPTTGKYSAGFRGGLDEVKVFSYAREQGGLMSEAARGIERLNKEQRRTVASRLPSCTTSDLECPAYHLCVDGACQMIGCNPNDPASCSRGLCTLRPLAAATDSTGKEWVCSSECNYNQQCFEKQCQNGPCRFCDTTTSSCSECRMRVDDYGSFKLQSLEGCPDRNSFACVDGNCTSECYSFVNGRSVYLCDPDNEYCYHGRCLLLDWDWSDLAPATFGGLAEARYSPKQGFVYTQAINQLYPIKVRAYGTEDHVRPPTILVEGRVSSGASAYGTNWFELGRITVYNTTYEEAEAKAYELLTNQHITHLRLRLLVPPYENLTASASGLGPKDKDFCVDDANTWAQSHGLPPDYSPCSWRYNSSRAIIGYDAGISRRDVLGASCTSSPCRYASDAYLRRGEQAVIITDVFVNGTRVTSQIESNLACSYEGTTAPYVNEGDSLRPRKLVFGDALLEQSNAKVKFCATHACARDSWGLVDYAAPDGPTGKAWGLLNCAFVHPTDATKVASVVISKLTIPDTVTQGAITETANGCVVNTTGTPVGTACYEWMGDVSVDPLNADLMMYRTIEFSSFSSFGY